MEKFTKITAVIALLTGVVSGIIMLSLGPGYKSGLWDFMFVYSKGFKIVVLLGLAAIVFAVIHLVASLIGKKRIAGMALIGLVAGAAGAAVPLKMQKIGKSVPAIHDITTDVNNPPQFVAIAPLRADASNPVTYDSAISEQQLKAYPDVKTIELQASSADVFSAALTVIDNLGWDIVESDSNTGRIEATETTTWFGFKDDVVIRISAINGKTMVDVRSKSRIGRSDLGANANRIRKFSEQLKSRL